MHMYSVPWWDRPHCITFLVSRIITSLCPGQLQNMSENVWYLRFCIWCILLNTFHFPCSLLQMAECYFLMAGFPFIRFILILVYMSVNACVCPQRPAEGVTPMPLKSQANVRGRMCVLSTAEPMSEYFFMVHIYHISFHSCIDQPRLICILAAWTQT